MCVKIFAPIRSIKMNKTKLIKKIYGTITITMLFDRVKKVIRFLSLFAI